MLMSSSRQNYALKGSLEVGSADSGPTVLTQYTKEWWGPQLIDNAYSYAVPGLPWAAKFTTTGVANSCNWRLRWERFAVCTKAWNVAWTKYSEISIEPYLTTSIDYMYLHIGIPFSQAWWHQPKPPRQLVSDGGPPASTFTSKVLWPFAGTILFSSAASPSRFLYVLVFLAMPKLSVRIRCTVDLLIGFDFFSFLARVFLTPTSWQGLFLTSSRTRVRTVLVPRRAITTPDLLRSRQRPRHNHLPKNRFVVRHYPDLRNRKADRDQTFRGCWGPQGVKRVYVFNFLFPPFILC